MPLSVLASHAYRNLVGTWSQSNISSSSSSPLSAAVSPLSSSYWCQRNHRKERIKNIYIITPLSSIRIGRTTNLLFDPQRVGVACVSIIIQLISVSGSYWMLTLITFSHALNIPLEKPFFACPFLFLPFPTFLPLSRQSAPGSHSGTQWTTAFISFRKPISYPIQRNP